jgi:hypothetical protein
LQPLETDKFQSWRLSHGKSSPAPMSEILTANTK